MTSNQNISTSSHHTSHLSTSHTCTKFVAFHQQLPTTSTASLTTYYHKPHVHHSNHSPYIFGLSPLTYASNVLFNTADQSKSRLSLCISLPPASASAWVNFPSFTRAAFAASSPALKRGPRSGQFRVGSNGFHLLDYKEEVSYAGRELRGERTERTRSCGSGTNTRRGRSHETQEPEAQRYFVQAYQRSQRIYTHARARQKYHQYQNQNQL